MSLARSASAAIARASSDASGVAVPVSSTRIAAAEEDGAERRGELVRHAADEAAEHGQALVAGVRLAQLGQLPRVDEREEPEERAERDERGEAADVLDPGAPEGRGRERQGRRPLEDDDGSERQEADPQRGPPVAEQAGERDLEGEEDGERVVEPAGEPEQAGEQERVDPELRRDELRRPGAAQHEHPAHVDGGDRDEQRREGSDGEGGHEQPRHEDGLDHAGERHPAELHQPATLRLDGRREPPSEEDEEVAPAPVGTSALDRERRAPSPLHSGLHGAS